MRRAKVRGTRVQLPPPPPIMIPPYLFHIQLIMEYYGGIFFASKSKIALFSRLYFLTLTDSQRPIFLSKTDDSSLLVLEVYVEKSDPVLNLTGDIRLMFSMDSNLRTCSNLDFSSIE